MILDSRSRSSRESFDTPECGSFLYCSHWHLHIDCSSLINIDNNTVKRNNIVFYMFKITCAQTMGGKYTTSFSIQWTHSILKALILLLRLKWLPLLCHCFDAQHIQYQNLFNELAYLQKQHLRDHEQLLLTSEEQSISRASC